MSFRLLGALVAGLLIPQVASAVTNSTIDVKADLYAVGDGNGYQLNTQFATLAAAQAAYPHVHAKWPITSLTSTTHYRDWCAIQEAVLACTDPDVTLHREIILPPGTYYVDRTIELEWNGTTPFLMRGAGRLNTYINSYTPSGYALKINQTANGFPKKGGWIRDLSFKHPPATALSGIYLRSASQFTFDNVGVESFNGDGIYVLCGAGEGLDSTSFLTIKNSFVVANTGWGINVDVSDGLTAVSFINMENCWIEQNGTAAIGGGGMRWRGQFLNTKNCGFTVNNQHGFLNYGPTPSQSIAMEETTFENTVGVHCELQAILNARFENCQLYSNATYKATKGFLIQGTGSHACENVTILGTIIRAEPEVVPYTAFDITGAQAKYTRIEQTRYDHWYTQTKFSDSGTNTRIEDLGEIYPYKVRAIIANLAAGGTHTLSKLYQLHSINLGATGNYTIAEPNPGPGTAGTGTLMDIELVGGTGTATVGFTGSWYADLPGPIGPGVRKSARFYFNNGIWRQLGAWR